MVPVQDMYEADPDYYMEARDIQRDKYAVDRALHKISNSSDHLTYDELRCLKNEIELLRGRVTAYREELARRAS